MERFDKMTLIEIVNELECLLRKMNNVETNAYLNAIKDKVVKQDVENIIVEPFSILLLSASYKLNDLNAKTSLEYGFSAVLSPVRR